jgi:SAM-dependent methyltransferase
MKGPEWQLYGIEMSVEAARKAQARSGGQVFVGDILQANFAAESFDVITCFDVLEHVYEPRSVVAKVRKWLRPQGVFYLVVPNIDSAAVRIFRSYWYGLELPRHLTHFSSDSLRVMLRAEGLEEMSLSILRYPAVEYSVRYVFDELLRSVGVCRKPLSMVPEPGIPWRIARKALRMSILPIVHRAISLAGPGEHIHAVFTKNGHFTSARNQQTR